MPCKTGKKTLPQCFQFTEAGDESGAVFHLQKFLALNGIWELLSASCLSVPEDLSLEERDELTNIRRRKRELLDDIEVSMCMCEWM